MTNGRSSLLPVPHVWTEDEIMAQPDHGWFYGFVRDEDGLGFYEIIPGMGWGKPFRRYSPRIWLQAVRHVFKIRPLYVGEEAREPAARRRVELDEQRAEFERKHEAGKTCTHPNAEPFLPDVNGGSWCPDCWLWTSPNEAAV